MGEPEDARVVWRREYRRQRLVRMRSDAGTALAELADRVLRLLHGRGPRRRHRAAAHGVIEGVGSRRG